MLARLPLAAWTEHVAAVSTITEAASEAASTTLRWVLKFNRRVTIFDDLPDDVLVEIMHAADLPTIFALRHTSRRLSRASKTYSVWSTALRYLAECCPSLQLQDLERPLSSYSPLELEEMVKRLVRLEKNLMGPISTPRRSRELEVGAKYSFIEFVPGGRWIILGTLETTGRILYCDLDSPALELKTLVEPGDKTGSGYPRAMTMCFNGDSETLEFDMALIYERVEHRKSDLKHPRVVSTWRVSLSSSFTSLVATNLQSFPLSTREIGVCSLRAGLLVRAVPHEEIKIRYEAYDVEKCSESSIMRAVVVPAGKDYQQVPGLRMTLLPYNRALTVTHARFAIYDFGSFAVDTGVASSPPPSQPLWSHVYWGGYGDFVITRWQPIPLISANQVHNHRPGIISISTYYREAIRILRIPANDAQKAEVDTIKLEETHRRLYTEVGTIGRYQGFRWTALQQPLSKFKATFTSWRPPKETALIRRFGGLAPDSGLCESDVGLLQKPFTPPQRPSEFEVFFDERSGRLILPIPHEKLLVMDYV